MARAATLTVTNTNDTGAGSLRAQILAATSGDAINFSVSGTITLGSSLPAIAINLTIDGTGQAITVDGASSFQILSVNSGATLNLQNLTLAHGHAVGFGGGINNGGTLTVNNCTFSGNSATVDGGGINNGGFATLTVTSSTFSGNGAGSGGGIANDSNGTLTVVNSTFSGNSVSGNGGGIVSFSTATVTNSTFSGNSASSGGGGILSTIGGSLKGTILASNAGGDCSGFFSPPVADAGYNIADDGTCGFTTPPTGTSVNNSTTLHLDPLGLQNNGGPTKTIALEATSQAVDFIPISNCTDQSSPTPVPLTTDQRGFARPDAGNPNFCDAGAYELLTSFDFTLNSEKIQIAHSASGTADQVNMALTFTHLPDLVCNAADDALHAGITVQLFAGSCGDLMGTGLSVDLSPFVVRTVNGTSYGTIFQMFPPETVSGRIVVLPTPEGTCGKWTLNLEVAGLDTVTLGLAGGNPFALLLTDSDLHGFGCFDITNAIVGNQILSPAKVRRGVRR